MTVRPAIKQLTIRPRDHLRVNCLCAFKAVFDVRCTKGSQLLRSQLFVCKHGARCVDFVWPIDDAYSMPVRKVAELGPWDVVEALVDSICFDIENCDITLSMKSRTKLGKHHMRQDASVIVARDLFWPRMQQVVIQVPSLYSLGKIPPLLAKNDGPLSGY